MNNTIPPIGLGTFRLKDQVVIDSVRNALELGYRHIDTAPVYGNEAEVGLAIASGGVARDDVFVTTKIWIDNLGRDKLIPSLKESLRKLRLQQADLTLIHWPSPNGAVPLPEYMAALAEAKARGWTRLIGVSNFTIDLLGQAIDAVGAAQIATLQVEMHPYLQNRKLLAYARSQGIHVTAYMSLANGKVLNDPVLRRIAADHQATPAQIALAWALRRGVSVIPSSTRRANLESNLKLDGILLSDNDMAMIGELECNGRLASPAALAPHWD